MEMENDPWNVTPKTESSSSTNRDGDSGFQQSNNNVNHTVSEKNDFGTISMVFGILSFFLSAFPWAVLGLVFGCISLSHKKNSHATVGVVCSSISLVLNIMIWIVLGVLFASIIPQITNLIESYI